LDEAANNVPDSEREVLSAVKHLSDDWMILHSVRWQSLRGGKQGDGEADFVILHRMHGVLVLEVKGGGITIEMGQWQSRDRHGQLHKIKNPYTQATQSKHALLRYLAEADDSLSQVGVAHAVVFPDVGRCADLGPSAPPNITLYSDDLLSIEPALLRAFEHWGASKPFSSSQLKRMVALLAPTVTVERRLCNDLRKTESEILRLTNSQQRVFSRLRSVSRLIVSGGPGTGKTLLAIERAKLMAQLGGRILVLCYNDLLSKAIGHQLEAFPQVEVATFHRFSLARIRASGFSIPNSPTPDWWDARAAELLGRALNSSAERFDGIIIDEAQDFAPGWFDSITSSLRDPEHGQVFAFADDRQELWNRNWKRGLTHFAEYELTDNCRNSASIAKCVNAIYGAAPPVAEVPGVPVLTVWYGPGDDLVQIVSDLGEHLLTKEGVAASDLAILTDDNALAEHLRATYLGETPIVSFGRSGIACETIGRFKGLESSALLLILTGRAGSAPINLANAYVGLSRARAVAVVVMQTSHPAATAIAVAAGRK
jgi:hypothetical protein